MADVYQLPMSKGGSMEFIAEQAIRCAVDQAVLDMADSEVTEASVYRKIVIDDQTSASGDDHCYVEITLRHPVEESTAMALYRVWRSAEGLKAIRVTIVSWP